MNKDQYWHSLRTNFGYRTPTRAGFGPGNVPGWPSANYYTRLVYIILKNSLIAWRGAYDNHKWAIASHNMVTAVESSGGSVRITGLDEVSRYRGPLVYIGNHMSLLETFVLPGVLLAFNDITFVVKEELLQYPVIGHLMRAVNLIGVTRQNPRADLKAVLDKGQDVLAKNRSVVIFPQATRSHMFDTGKFNSLGVKLASRSKVPVVPMAIKTDFQSVGRRLKEVGPINPGKTVRIKFGSIIPVEENSRSVHQAVVDFITENLQRWGVGVE